MIAKCHHLFNYVKFDQVVDSLHTVRRHRRRRLHRLRRIRTGGGGWLPELWTLPPPVQNLRRHPRKRPPESRHRPYRGRRPVTR